jgi:type IV pilus assembly protein PilQ
MNTGNWQAVSRTNGVCARDLWKFLVMLAVFPPITWGATASLDRVNYAALPGDRVQVRLELSAPPAKVPLNFSVDRPARIALDLADTRLNLPAKNQAINLGVAQSVSAIEAGGRTRVVLNLTRMAPYDVKTEGSAIVVTIGDKGVTTAARVPAPTPVVAPARPATRPTYVPMPRQAVPPAPRDVIPRAPAYSMPAPEPARPVVRSAMIHPSGPALEDIDFRRGEQGEGRVKVMLTDPSTDVNIREEGGKIVVDFNNVYLPERLDRRLDVMDFATAIKEIDTTTHGNGARMVITPTGNYEHLAYQSDNTFMVEVRPFTREEEDKAKKEKSGYTGERLSLNFQDIEVRAVLQLIADFTNLNIVASDTVSGNVTLRLKNVPWDQALDIILKSKGLGMRQMGNVLMVAPQEEIAAREKLELEAQKQLIELAPLKTEFVQINYAKAADIATLLKTEGNKLLSERGNVSVDDRTNTLLIQETADRLAEIRNLVSTLDVAVRQVLIESRIVIANQDFSKELGVKFGYSKRTISQDGFGVVTGGKKPGDTEFTDADGDAIGTGFTTDDMENFIVNLPSTAASSSAWGLAIGKVGSWLLQLELSALQAEDRGEVISNPRVITADQKEAVIEQGVEIPYQQSTSSGATAVAFKKAVLSLKVTPHITPDDRINMRLAVNKDSVGQLVGRDQIPSINTQNVVTEVLVANGETVVLGGVYQQENTKHSDRVPFFGDLPYFGNLFKRSTQVNKKGELLIFVTPKIIKNMSS